MCRWLARGLILRAMTTVIGKKRRPRLTEHVLQKFVAAHLDQKCYVGLVSGTTARLGFQEIADQVRRQMARAKQHGGGAGRTVADVKVLWVHETCADVIVSLGPDVDRRASRLWFVLQVMAPSHEQASGKTYRLVVPDTPMKTTVVLNVDAPFGGDLNLRSFFYYWCHKNARKMTKYEKAMVEHTIKWFVGR